MNLLHALGCHVFIDKCDIHHTVHLTGVLTLYYWPKVTFVKFLLYKVSMLFFGSQPPSLAD